MTSQPNKIERITVDQDTASGQPVYRPEVPVSPKIKPHWKWIWIIIIVLIVALWAFLFVYYQSHQAPFAAPISK